MLLLASLVFLVALFVFSSAYVLAFSSSCPPPTNGAIAQYCKATDTFAVNEQRLSDDLKCRFCYFRNPSTRSGEQKRRVFAKHDPRGERLEAYVRPGTPGALDRYRKFVIAHERAHQRLHRHIPIPRDLLHPKVIAIEVQANVAAYDQLGI
jgi:hypothetical protein